MVAQPPLPPTPSPLSAKLFSTAGVVVLAGVVAASGGVLVLWLESTPAPVEVFEVTAHFAWNETSGAGAALKVDALRLPHCAAAYLNPNPRELWVYGPPLDRAVTSVVMVHYADPTSLSGGGDDTAVFALKRGELATVTAALNTSTVLYRLDPGGRPPIVVAAATLSGPDRVDAQYLVNGTLGGDLRSGSPQTGNFLVEEHHAVEDLGALPVVNRGLQGCE